MRSCLNHGDAEFERRESDWPTFTTGPAIALSFFVMGGVGLHDGSMVTCVIVSTVQEFALESYRRPKIV